jgi:hypothetical protein
LHFVSGNCLFANWKSGWESGRWPTSLRIWSFQWRSSTQTMGA